MPKSFRGLFLILSNNAFGIISKVINFCGWKFFGWAFLSPRSFKADGFFFVTSLEKSLYAHLKVLCSHINFLLTFLSINITNYILIKFSLPKGLDKYYFFMASLPFFFFSILHSLSFRLLCYCCCCGILVIVCWNYGFILLFALFRFFFLVFLLLRNFIRFKRKCQRLIIKKRKKKKLQGDKRRKQQIRWWQYFWNILHDMTVKESIFYQHWAK